VFKERLISDIKSYIELRHFATRSRHDGIVEDTDRYGNVRFYLRVKERKKVRLREKPGTVAFRREYECAEKGIPYGEAPVVADLVKPVVARSFRWLCQEYPKRAANTVTFDTISRRRRLLENICIKHGVKPFELLERKHVTAIRVTRIDSPGAEKSHLGRPNLKSGTWRPKKCLKNKSLRKSMVGREVRSVTTLSFPPPTAVFTRKVC